MSVTKIRERRRTMRFDKVFPVTVSSEHYGEVGAVARNISSGGMLIETGVQFPLGSLVHVHFQIPDSSEDISACAEVKNHYSLNYCEGPLQCSARGVGVRFLEFQEADEGRLRDSLTPYRTLH